MNDIICFRQNKLDMHFADDNLWICDGNLTTSFSMKEEEHHKFIALLKRALNELKDEDDYIDVQGEKSLAAIINQTDSYMIELFFDRNFISFRIKHKRMEEFDGFIKKGFNQKFSPVYFF